MTIPVLVVSQNPQKSLAKQRAELVLPGSFTGPGETFIVGLDHHTTGSKVGDNLLLEHGHEPRVLGLAETNSLGNRTGQHRRRRNRRGQWIGEARSVGRYPFLNRVEAYLHDSRKPNELTFKERRRKLLMLARVYEDLRTADPSLHADPKRFSEREVNALVDWMRSTRKAVGYQVKLMQYLRLLLHYLGNPVLDHMNESKADLPKPVLKRLHAPTQDEMDDRRRRLESITGWRGEALRFAEAFHLATGVRVKELRLAGLGDLDLRRMRFAILHPKGEGRYADGGRSIRLPGWMRPVVDDFLHARARRCETMGLDPSRVEPLIPAWMGRFYSEAGWRGVRVKAYREAGIVGNLRELRPAHAMLLKKAGVSIEAVSQRLGHTNTKTTEAHYARIEDADAEEAIVRALEAFSVTKRPN